MKRMTFLARAGGVSKTSQVTLALLPPAAASTRYRPGVASAASRTLDHGGALADDRRRVRPVDGHADGRGRRRAGKFHLEVELGARQDLRPVYGIDGLGTSHTGGGDEQYGTEHYSSMSFHLRFLCRTIHADGLPTMGGDADNADQGIGSSGPQR